MTQARAALAVAAGLAAPDRPAVGAVDGRECAGPPVEWRLDNLERIGGHAVTVVGAPRVVDRSGGAVGGVRRRRRRAGLIAANPLAGLSRFTIEVEFQPAADGAEEQRFVHFEEAATRSNRALIELRMQPDGRWALDTFLRSPAPGLTLLDRARRTPRPSGTPPRSSTTAAP